MKRKHKLKSLNQSFLTLLLAGAALSASSLSDLQAQAPAVDPKATRILKRMTDYLGGLKQFTVQTQNTLQDTLDSGHLIDVDVSAQVMISRPNKIRSERKGELVDQVFYYDGKTLTLCHPDAQVYATVPAPETIEGTLDFARESLGLIVPVADLVYRNAFPSLMQEVTLAKAVGKSVINGVACDHLLFSRPGVDFQVWVAASGPPLPHKYVVTDTGMPARLSVTAVMSDWNVSPELRDALFEFEPPNAYKPITFLPLEPNNESVR